MIYWPAKQPDEVVDYLFDWSGALQEGEAISSKLVSATGVTVDSSAIESDGVRVWLSGGSEGSVARVTCTIVTGSAPARTLSETAVLTIGAEAVSLADVKRHLKIEVEDEEEDALVAAYLAAAVSHVETVTGKCLTPRVVRHVAAGFPGDGVIKLFKGPVQEVVAVEYDPADGDGTADTAVALLDYRLAEGHDATLSAAVGALFPATIAGRGSVRVDYVAGYGPGEMPRALGQAVLLLVGHFHRNRESVVTGTIATAVPMSVDALIAPYRAIGIA